MLVGVAIVFPVVFSIGSAYNRRESALQRFSDFKGHAIAIFYATRDWTTDKDHNLPQQVREIVTQMMAIMRKMFTSSNTWNIPLMRWARMISRSMSTPLPLIWSSNLLPFCIPVIFRLTMLSTW